MCINPIGSSYYPVHCCRAPQPTPVNTPYVTNPNLNPSGKKPGDTIVNANYDPAAGILKITENKYMAFDAGIWNTIKKDGSGDTISAWGIGCKYPAGTFSAVLNEAEKLYTEKGRLDEEDAQKLAEQFGRITQEVKGEEFKMRFAS